MIPYSRQEIDEDDIAAVVESLRSGWLTTGPKVAEFERAFAAFCAVPEAVAVSNGTAALHCILHALDLRPGDEVLVPAITFVASANAVRYVGAVPIHCDVDPATLLIDPLDVERKITPRTRAIVAVDYAGQPCDYPRLREIADRHGLKLVADACHAVGGSLHGRPVGSLADFSAFSFHPVKPMTTAEGGMVTTADATAAARMRVFRSHGISTDARQREEKGAWSYDMAEIGYNYRLTDLQSALGLSQLRKLPGWTARRARWADLYRRLLAPHADIRPLAVREGVVHAYHLFVVALEGAAAKRRDEVFRAMRAAGIGVNVLYRPIYQHSCLAEERRLHPPDCPNAERMIDRILALPLFPGMDEGAVERVCRELVTAVEAVSS
jgi:perosamine synthetase